MMKIILMTGMGMRKNITNQSWIVNFLDLNKVSHPLISFSIIQFIRLLLRNALFYTMFDPNDILHANEKYFFFGGLL